MCKCKIKRPRFVKIDQSANGVRVVVTKFLDRKGAITGSTVEADCGCFGHPIRVHTNPSCPVRLEPLR